MQMQILKMYQDFDGQIHNVISDAIAIHTAKYMVIIKSQRVSTRQNN